MKNSKKGFTLAEVLITLTIIGVVAALTIPSVVRKYEKAQWIASYKETYSILNQATMMVKTNNGGTLQGAWDYSAGDHMGIYNAYVPHLKTTKDCGYQFPVSDCFEKVGEYIDLQGGGASIMSTTSVILANGTIVGFASWPAISTIYVDTNGSKGPNQRGKDMHILVFDMISDTIKPQWWDQDESSITSYCNSDLTGNDGGTCGIRILRGDYGTAY